MYCNTDVNKYSFQNVTKNCPIDDQQYEYAEKFTIHDLPAVVTRYTIIDFNVTDVSKDWTLKSNSADGVCFRLITTKNIALRSIDESYTFSILSTWKNTSTRNVKYEHSQRSYKRTKILNVWSKIYFG